MKSSILALTILIATIVPAQPSEKEPTSVQRVVTFDGMSAGDVQGVVEVFSEADFLAVYSRDDVTYARMSGTPAALDALEATIAKLSAQPNPDVKPPEPSSYRLTYYVVLGSEAPLETAREPLPLPEVAQKTILEGDPIAKHLQLRLLDTNVVSLLAQPDHPLPDGRVRATGTSEIKGFVTTLELVGQSVSSFYDASISLTALDQANETTTLYGEARSSVELPYLAPRYSPKGDLVRHIEYRTLGTSANVKLTLGKPQLLSKFNVGVESHTVYFVIEVAPGA